jgi:hypothetical protein
MNRAHSCVEVWYISSFDLHISHILQRKKQFDSRTIEQELGPLLFVSIVTIDYEFVVPPKITNLFKDVRRLFRTPKFYDFIGLDIAEFFHKETDTNIAKRIHVDSLFGNIVLFRFNELVQIYKTICKKLLLSHRILDLATGLLKFQKFVQHLFNLRKVRVAQSSTQAPFWDHF